MDLIDSIPVMETTNSSIINFYNGKSIFITGGTGFLGTVLIEKLLFSCQSIKNIYVLIKQKRDQSVEQRISQHFKSKAFQRLKEKDPNFMNKIIPVVGNILEKNLGISDDNMAALQSEVSIVFHSAAKLSFNMSLKNAIETNTKSTGELIRICKNMPKLKAFVYVSTAYSNCQKNVIDEKVYRNDIPLDTVYEILQNATNESMLNQLLGERPNTYTYSKALSEELIESNAHDVPSVIVRPSIIISAKSEPVPGWLSGWNGLSVVIAAAMNGYVKYLHANYLWVLDTIPVDYTANLMIATAWEANIRRLKGDRDVKVFNCCTGTQNPIKSGKLVSMVLDLNQKNSKDNKKTNTKLTMTQNYYWFFILFLFAHTIPAIIMDCFSWLLGKKMTSYRRVMKLKKLLSSVEFFTLRQFLFIDNNVRKLFKSMNESDQLIFDFDVKNIQWSEYLKGYAYGLNEFNQ